MTTFGQAASKGFNTLVTLWNGGTPFYAPNGGCFWMAGNTLHAAITHMVATAQPDTYNFAGSALQIFDTKITDFDPTNWVNDGAWEAKLRIRKELRHQ